MRDETPQDAGQHAGALPASLCWRTSGHGDPAGDCVELAPLPDGGVAVRHSGDREGPVLVYTQAEITAFLLGAKDGEFDDLLPELA